MFSKLFKKANKTQKKALDNISECDRLMNKLEQQIKVLEAKY